MKIDFWSIPFATKERFSLFIPLQTSCKECSCWNWSNGALQQSCELVLMNSILGWLFLGWIKLICILNELVTGSVPSDPSQFKTIIISRQEIKFLIYLDQFGQQPPAWQLSSNEKRDLAGDGDGWPIRRQLEISRLMRRQDWSGVDDGRRHHRTSSQHGDSLSLQLITITSATTVK